MYVNTGPRKSLWYFGEITPAFCDIHWKGDYRTTSSVSMLHDDLGLRDVKGRRPDLRLVLLYVTGIGSDQIGLVAADNRTRSNHRYKFRAIWASDVLVMTTLLLHSFMRSSQAESIIAAVSWLALRRRRPTSCNVSSTLQHESSRRLEHAQVRPGTLISGEVSYTGWTLTTRFGSAVCTRLLLNTCRPTTNPSPAFLVVATCDWLTAWSSRLPTCETCFVRRTFICIYIRRPFKFELTSCSP